MNPLLLIGGGGHCHACIDVIESSDSFEIRGIVEISEGGSESVLGYPVIGYDSNLPELLKSTPAAMVTVGQVKSPAVRIDLYSRLIDLGAHLPTVISPLSYVSRHSSIGAGAIVMHGAIVNSLASVGNNCIVNSQALIEHDAVVQDHCHISTGARVNGGASVGSRTFIGSGAVLREGVRVGTNCVVGAGAVVIEDVPDSSTYLGLQ